VIINKIHLSKYWLYNWTHQIACSKQMLEMKKISYGTFVSKHFKLSHSLAKSTKWIPKRAKSKQWKKYDKLAEPVFFANYVSGSANQQKTSFSHDEKNEMSHSTPSNSSSEQTQSNELISKFQTKLKTKGQPIISSFCARSLELRDDLICNFKIKNPI
jgi:hypothetical protein